MTVRERRFSGGLRAPADARRAVRETLDEMISRPVRDDVELLVSELVTNSVRHGGGDERTELAMDTDVREERVLVRVFDDGEGFEAAAPAKTDLETAGGYGLVLLNTIASDWGVEHGARFCVWFELDRR